MAAMVAALETLTGDAAAKNAAVLAAGVSYAFGNEKNPKPVLHAVDLTLERGAFVILTGPSGAGKTTLMTLIGALRALQSGSIEVFGTELAGLPPAGQRDIRRRIGFIFQDHNLFDALTVFQTLRLATELADVRPSHDAALEMAAAMLASLGMEDYLHSRPGELSTGQKQRIAIARALINHPRLILADEPTASLDREAAGSVIALIKRRIAEDRASALMVTHDTRLFDIADRVVNMEDGKIVRMS